VAAGFIESWRVACGELKHRGAGMMERIVVRQPVFGTNQEVFGYKILCFSNRPDSLDSIDHAEASLKEIENTFLLIGFDRIAGRKKAFVDLTKSLFAGETGISLPKDHTIVEVSYSLKSKQALLRSCKALKEAGYVIAADSLVINDEDLAPVADLIDIIKIRPGQMGTALKRMQGRPSAARWKLLAEKVNSQEEFHRALEAGCHYFHGHFFSEPVIISGKDIPQYELTQLRILNEVNRQELDYAALENVIKVDVSLCYKLLKFINSPFFGLRREVSSIKQALNLLGENEIRKWTSLVIMKSLGKNKPVELVVTSLVRAGFSESLASRIGLKDTSGEAFLVGLFSMLDAFLGIPLKEIIREMPLSEDIKGALTGKRNKYRRLLDLVLSYEMGEIRTFLSLAAKLNIKEGTITDLYLNAIDRAEDALQLYGPGKTSAHE
jgi:c-di-GMP-related signal transduction protein